MPDCVNQPHPPRTRDLGGVDGNKVRINIRHPLEKINKKSKREKNQPHPPRTRDLDDVDGNKIRIYNRHPIERKENIKKTKKI